MICTTCKIAKSEDAFHRCKTMPNGRYKICKECRKLSSKSQRIKHGERLRAEWRENHKLNPEKHRANARAYQQDNWEHRKAYMRDWNKKNPGKAAAHWARRNAAKLQATPPWLTKEQFKQIQWFYITAKELQWLAEDTLTVDHIEPLRGELSCGLHVPWNLQILGASLNYSKGNKLEYK